jgi:hypothetical protein
MDHIYPIPHPPGTPCYCGDRTWADAPRRSSVLKAGASVRVMGIDAVIVGKERGEDVYRLDRIIGGRTLFDGNELEIA